MRKIILSVMFCFLIFPAGLTLATLPPKPPPSRMSTVTSIALSYDLIKASLHIDATHPSDNWEIDYVRMMTISLNGQVISTVNYYHQTTDEGFVEDIPLKAQVGDVITVDLFCTGGSSMAQDLTVTESGAAQPDLGTDAGTNNSTTDNTAS